MTGKPFSPCNGGKNIYWSDPGFCLFVNGCEKNFSIAFACFWFFFFLVFWSSNFFYLFFVGVGRSGNHAIKLLGCGRLMMCVFLILEWVECLRSDYETRVHICLWLIWSRLWRLDNIILSRSEVQYLSFRLLRHFYGLSTLLRLNKH